ncbi:acyltransferase domain-containing protein [Streptomyces sp. NPDC006990]|uniref:acyltransferase domain-containing protein n=1 Tax=unclassified Streptomyces TaxID=2593676 RepID=UPI003452CBA5
MSFVLSPVPEGTAEGGDPIAVLGVSGAPDAFRGAVPAAAGPGPAAPGRPDPGATAVFLEGSAGGAEADPVPGAPVERLPAGDPPLCNAVAAALSWLRDGAARTAVAGTAARPGGRLLLRRLADARAAGEPVLCLLELATGSDAGPGVTELLAAVRRFQKPTSVATTRLAPTAVAERPTAAPERTATAPDRPAPEPGQPARVRDRPALSGAVPWPVSGRSETGMRTEARLLAAHLRERPELDGHDVAHALATGRGAAGHRGVAVGADREELLAGLDALAAGHDHQGVVCGTARPAGGVVMMFPGAGGQWRGMGGGLWDSSPAFRESVLACAEAFAPYVDWSLVDVVRGRRGAASLNRVEVVQPALFTVTVSLAAVWRSFGVVPAAVLGHSQGEIAAAHVAGALPLPDAARVVAARSRLIAGALAGKGAMLSVPLPAAQVRERLAELGGGLAVAAVNGPATTSVAGSPDAIEELFARLVDEGVRVARIVSDFASHSAQVEAIHGPLLDEVGPLRHHATDTLLCSTVTGRVLDPAALDTEYWYQNLRRTVEFDSAVRTLLSLGFSTFVEPSAHPLLTAPVADIAADTGTDVRAVGSLRMGESTAQRMLTSLAEAQVAGVPVDWGSACASRGRIELPTGPLPAPSGHRTAADGADAVPGAAGPAAPGAAGDGFWRAVDRGDLAGALGVVLPALSWSNGS